MIDGCCQVSVLCNFLVFTTLKGFKTKSESCNGDAVRLLTVEHKFIFSFPKCLISRVLMLNHALELDSTVNKHKRKNDKGQKCTETC